MKRRKLADIDQKPSAMEADSSMIELNRLDEADVRHDRCPICKNKGLDRLDGFKICPRCDTNFKVLDGKAYIIDGEKGENVMANRIVARLKKTAADGAKGQLLSLADSQEGYAIIAPLAKSLAAKYDAAYGDEEDLEVKLSNDGYEDYANDQIVDEDDTLTSIIDALIAKFGAQVGLTDPAEIEKVKAELVDDNAFQDLVVEAVVGESSVDFDDLQSERDTEYEQQQGEWAGERNEQERDYWNSRF